MDNGEVRITDVRRVIRTDDWKDMLQITFTANGVTEMITITLEDAQWLGRMANRKA